MTGRAAAEKYARHRAAVYAAAYTFPVWLMRHKPRERSGLMAEIRDVMGSELESLKRHRARLREAGDAESVAWLDAEMVRAGAAEDWPAW